MPITPRSTSRLLSLTVLLLFARCSSVAGYCRAASGFPTSGALGAGVHIRVCIVLAIVIRRLPVTRGHSPLDLSACDVHSGGAARSSGSA